MTTTTTTTTTTKDAKSAANREAFVTFLAGIDGIVKGFTAGTRTASMVETTEQVEKVALARLLCALIVGKVAGTADEFYAWMPTVVQNRLRESSFGVTLSNHRKVVAWKGEGAVAFISASPSLQVAYQQACEALKVAKPVAVATVVAGAETVDPNEGMFVEPAQTVLQVAMHAVKACSSVADLEALADLCALLIENTRTLVAV